MELKIINSDCLGYQGWMEVSRMKRISIYKEEKCSLTVARFDSGHYIDIMINGHGRFGSEMQETRHATKPTRSHHPCL